MKSLYQISNEMQELYFACSSSVNDDGEVTDESVFEKLGEITDQFEEKAEGYGIVIRMMNADIDQYEAEIKRLKAMKQREESRRDYLLNRVQTAMIMLGIDEVSRPGAVLKFGNSNRTVCESVNDLPDEYVKVTIERKPDLVKIKQAIESGIAVTGCYIDQIKTLKVR